MADDKIQIIYPGSDVQRLINEWLDRLAAEGKLDKQQLDMLPRREVIVLSDGIREQIGMANYDCRVVGPEAEEEASSGG